VWDQSNEKQMILVSMATQMYKQYISMKFKKESVAVWPLVAAELRG
jgi:hypothetical protein